MSKTATERFLEYVRFDTGSDSSSESFPSTEKQKVLARVLADELTSLGVSNVFMDEKYGYVYGRIPATSGKVDAPKLAFLAHMDTSEEASGKDVKPRLVSNYDGGEVILNEELGLVLSPDKYPELKNYVGKTLVVTDGTTLLGADDKAGVAEIMTMVEILFSPDYDGEHGEISIVFTPDEETGRGVDYIDLDRVGADYGYTVDGGGIGELEYENFNAACADITINGVSIHPGDSKGKMVNASRLAMEFDSKIPNTMRPETTEKYEGFFHLDSVTGSVEQAQMYYIIRDHDRDLLEKKKELIHSVCQEINDKYGEGTCSIEVNDQYYNMREKIYPENMFLIDNAKAAYEAEGITPIIKPIRGGTDGARLSFMGLPCPNICTGGRNYHGRYEYCCSEDMETISRILVRLTSAF